ncbi:MAG: YafY family protein [Christensenella sp.]|nr:YafY family protein [Christensenella sp.]
MKVDRLVSMILILLEQQRVGAQELADRFEVSVRTIYRDMEAINQAGIPVRSTSGVGGGFEIMEQYKLDRTVFSTDDLSAILMGLSSLSGMMRGDELVNALAKVRSFIPADRAKSIELRANQIYIDLSPWIGNRNVQPYLERIKTALQQSRLLSFEYADRYGSKTARTAEPYQLVLKSNHWYLHGYCHMRSDFRLFKLARMSELSVEEKKFSQREFPKPQLDASEVIVKMQTIMIIRIHQSILDRVLDFCTQEDVSPDGDEQYIVQFPFIENDYYYGILLSFGEKCECLEPPSIRAEVKRRIRNIAAIYES